MSSFGIHILFQHSDKIIRYLKSPHRINKSMKQVTHKGSQAVKDVEKGWNVWGESAGDCMSFSNNVSVCYGDKCPLSSSPSSVQTYVATPERDGLYLPQISSGEKINKYNSSLCENVCVWKCVWKRVAIWTSLNRKELTGRANRSFPFRLGVWGEVVWWWCVESDGGVYACVCACGQGSIRE